METQDNFKVQLMNKSTGSLRVLVIAYLLILLSIFIYNYHKSSEIGRYVHIQENQYLDTKTGDILFVGADSKLHKINYFNPSKDE